MAREDDKDPYAIDLVNKLDLNWNETANHYPSYDDRFKYIDGAPRQLSFDFSNAKNKRKIDRDCNEEYFLEFWLGMFDNFLYLEGLDLSHNMIDHLPNGIFDNLSNLDYLNLSNNSIKRLPINIFDKLNKLRSLNLSLNNLSELPVGIFDNLNNLRSLSICGNSISDLDPSLFSHNHNLKYLYLSNNKLNSLASSIFSANPALQTIDLRQNCIDCLPNDIFASNSQLEEIYLQENAITSIPRSFVQHLDQLVVLSLKNNKFTNLLPLDFHPDNNDFRVEFGDNPIPIHPSKNIELRKKDFQYLVPYCLSSNKDEAREVVEQLVRNNVYTNDVLAYILKNYAFNLTENDTDSLLAYARLVKSTHYS